MVAGLVADFVPVLLGQDQATVLDVVLREGSLVGLGLVPPSVDQGDVALAFLQLFPAVFFAALPSPLLLLSCKNGVGLDDGSF
jgi:hypothetical protein